MLKRSIRCKKEISIKVQNFKTCMKYFRYSLDRERCNNARRNILIRSEMPFVIKQTYYIYNLTESGCRTNSFAFFTVLRKRFFFFIFRFDDIIALQNLHKITPVWTANQSIITYRTVVFFFYQRYAESKKKTIYIITHHHHRVLKRNTLMESEIFSQCHQTA